MKVSVFSPSHNVRYLGDCYRSLVAQTHTDWEWVVVLNKGAAWQPPAPDPRAHFVRAPTQVSGIGALKRLACEKASGEILVELDHDDVLTPDCLAQVVAAFEAAPGASLVYSDFTQVNADGSPNHDHFDPGAGWEYVPEEMAGTTYERCLGLAPWPHNIGYIWYAPNHVRAFRRSAYEEVGGYNADLDVLDDQDLMARLYEVGEFVHVDRLLYLQRVHARNTQSAPRTNARIQDETVALYDRTIDGLAAAWAARAGLRRLWLATPTSPPHDADISEEVVLVDPARPALDMPDNSVGVVKMVDFLQRAPDRASLFNECARVLAHGGLVLTQTPSTDGRGGFQDPSHVSFWNENSFWYLTQAGLHFALPELKARLQVSRLATRFPTPWHEQVNIPYVYANLLAIKDGPRQGGPLLS